MRLLVYWLHLINRPISLDDARIAPTLKRRTLATPRFVLSHFMLTHKRITDGALAAVRYCRACVIGRRSLIIMQTCTLARYSQSDECFSRIHLYIQKAACGNLKEIFIFRDFECVSSHFVHHVAAVANTDRESVVRSAQHLH